MPPTLLTLYVRKHVEYSIPMASLRDFNNGAIKINKYSQLNDKKKNSLKNLNNMPSSSSNNKNTKITK
jgi:hypothetical protein